MAFLDTAGLERLWIHICAKFDGLIGKSGTGTGSEIFNSYDSNSAEGDYSHAEGKGTTASGDYSHAEGQSTTASQSWAHAEGFHATASGQSSHAEGTYTVAGSSASHAEGYYTIASSANQHAQGMYNIEDKSGQYCHIVGNGESTARSNAHTLDWDGNAWYAGTVKVGGTSYADASEVALKSDVDSIKIGGRNLLLGSANPTSKFAFVPKDGTSTKTEETMLGATGVTVDVTTASTGWYYWMYSFGASRMALIKPSTQYTLSFDIYPSVDCSWLYRLVDSNSTNYASADSNTVSVPANTWTHVVLTATTTASFTVSGQVVYLYGTNKVGTFKFCNFKLEEGNKATAWTAAPEDMDGKVTTSNVAPTSETYYYPAMATTTDVTTGTLSTHSFLKTSIIKGTTSTVGKSKITLGNGTASGTDNNSQGVLNLYSEGTGAGALTQTKTDNWPVHYLPTTGGTILNDSSSLDPSKLSSAVPITKGGTGATTRVDAFNNLINAGAVNATTNTDWNAIISSGVYRVSSLSGTGAPTGIYEYGELFVIRSSTTVTQIYMSHRHEIMVRQSWETGGEDTSQWWTNWSKVAINISSGTSEPPSSGTAGSVYIQYSE